MAAKPKPKKKSEGETIYKRVNDWDSVKVTQKKDDLSDSPSPSWAVEDLLRVQKELDHEQYLHRLTKRENDKLIAKRKSTCTEIKRLREQNQFLKREIEQALLTVADLSRPWWKRFRKMDEETH